MTAGEDHMPTRLSVRGRTLRRDCSGATSRMAALLSEKEFTVLRYIRQSVWQAGRAGAEIRRAVQGCVRRHPAINVAASEAETGNRHPCEIRPIVDRRCA